MNRPAQFKLLGEIETPRPLRAPSGRLDLAGWCLTDGSPELPEIRLRIAGLELTASRLSRPDLAISLPLQPAAGSSGYRFIGTVPAGLHILTIEGKAAGGGWQLFRQATLAVESPPLQGAVDTPIAEGILSDRVKVAGWAIAPGHMIQRLVLRYGHRELPCSTGLVRDDVGNLADGAKAAGFESEDFLVAGHGPVRLKAWLEDGSVGVTPTRVTFSIAEDENHPRALHLDAPRVSLPASVPAVPAPIPPAPQPLNILFILPGSFAANSALHVAALANELARAGHRCAVTVSHDLDTLAHHEAPAFRGLLHATAETGLTFADGRGADLIHAWTTRENVRRLAEKIRARDGARLVVHLEDNEQQLLALTLGRSTAELAALDETTLDTLVPADLSHPRRSRDFLSTADAVTVITDRLREFVPAGRPCHTIWPAADGRFFRPHPRPDALRRVLDPQPDTTVLFYHGNVHAANVAEVAELYAAVARLNASGHSVTLIRTGLDAVPLPAPVAAAARPHVLELGQILHHRHLPALMSLADVFVQPGAPDAFNDYRFPSKLPEFFALGRPVILPRSNLGLHVRHGVDAYVLDRADAAGIAAAITELRRDPALAARLAGGAAAFAEKNFSWVRSAEALAKFYATLTPS